MSQVFQGVIEMMTKDELLEKMKKREDVYSVLDLIDPTVDELLDALFEDEDLIDKNFDMLVEYYEEEDIIF